MIKYISGDLYQIGESVSGKDGCVAVRVYVLLNDGCPLLLTLARIFIPKKF